METKLQELRDEKNLSQEILAKELGVTRQAYSRYERGERELGYNALIKLAKFFDVSIDYLLCNSTYYYPDNVKGSSPAEESLLQYFRALNPELQGVALETVRVLAGAPAGDLQKKA